MGNARVKLVTVALLAAGVWLASAPASASAWQPVSPAVQAPAPAPTTPESQPAPAVTPPAPAGVPVLWEGRELYRVYAALGPVSAEQRAELATERLEQLVREGFPPESLTVRHLETRSELYAGERLLGIVSDEDAAAVGRPRVDVAEQVLGILRGTLRDAEREQSTQGRLVQAGEAALATFVLLLVLLIVRAVSRRARRVIEAAREQRRLHVHVQQAEVLSADRLAGLLQGLIRVVATVIIIVAVMAWFQAVLLVLPLTRGFARAVVGYVTAPLVFVWQAFVGFVPSLFFLIVIAAAAWALLKAVHFFFREVELGTIRLGEFQPEWAEPTYKLVRVLVIVMGFVAAFPYIPGSGSPAFQGVSLFLGLLVSLSSSSAISNIISGTILTYTDAFRLGDVVKVGDTLGEVTRKTLLVTRVKTFKNVVTSIPNAIVLNSAIVNYSRLAREGRLILNTSVTIGYDAPWRTVHELLIAAARATEGIAAEPEPFVLQTALNDFFVTYELNAYTRDAHRMPWLYASLHASIQDRFNEAGVEIMSPHFSALRDGNAPALPPTPPGPRDEPRAFRVRDANRDRG